MRKFEKLKGFCKNEEGATAIEYGLIVSLIVIACIVAMQGVANENSGLWATVIDRVSAVIGGA